MHAEIFIETERLYLRQWQTSDQDPYIAMNQDSDVMEFFPSTLTVEQSIAHIEKNKKCIAEKG